MRDNILKIIFLMIFVIYITIFFSSSNGYFEYKNREKKNLTEEQIKKFEEDVRNGEYIDINTYINTTDINYQNGFSNCGEKLSNIISNGISSAVNYSFKFIIKFMG